MGRKAQSEGDLAERWAERSFRQYQADGRLVWYRTYPEIRVLYQGKGNSPNVIITGEATPDYLLCIEGRLLWLEVKTWEAMDRHTENRRLHQYRQMCETAQAGGMAAYLVLWKWDTSSEWRLHPVQSLKTQASGNLLFERYEGIPVNDSQGWPDWLSALISSERYESIVKNDQRAA